MARPKLQLDENLIEKLASIHCTMIEIASICGCSVDTLENRYSDLIKRAKDTGKSSLRRHQWAAVEKGNVVMMIWLGKQLLGQTEKIEQSSTHVIEKIKEIEALPKEEKIKRLEASLKQLKESNE